MNRETILVVEDDQQIRKYISYILTENQYQSIEAEDAKTAYSIFASNKIDMVILDLGLPDIGGYEVIKKIREWSNIPIIVVSANDHDKEKVIVLDAGADDYMTKPFSANELLARIRVAIRHLSMRQNSMFSTIFELKELKIDFDKQKVTLKNESIHLTRLEYKLLKLLALNCGKVLTTGYILREVWGANYGNDTQVLRTLMAGLRRKIESDPTKSEYIMTEIGVGYRLVEG